MTYEEWLAARRYRIVRSNFRNGRHSDAVEASGLTLAQARQRESELSEAEQNAHPELTNWTIDQFLVELETPPWKPAR